MGQRIVSRARYYALTWSLLMAIVAVVAVTAEGDVSGGVLGGIVTVAMLVFCAVALVRAALPPAPPAPA